MAASQDRTSSPASPELETYWTKRDFTRTAEPHGERVPAAPGEPLRFVVQRHRARRLHYDLRFEMGGVLASWAVPRGPTLDPAARRLAVHVEDHPLEYETFEGVIPAGEYGGGDVIVWDHGTWEPLRTDDPVAAVAAGELHAELHGTRLKGRFLLVRRGEEGGKEQWLLLHKHDEHAVEGWDAEDHPTSVVSGRTNDEVKADPDRLWRSDLPPDRASVELHAPPVPGPTADELAALDELGAGGTWDVLGRRLRVTNLDKVLFPGRGDEPPVTKRELLSYTARIAPVVLPYLRGRALNMHRFPEGAGSGKGFWHKELPGHAPAWVPRWDNPEADEGETHTYLVVDEPAALVWAANFGALEWHAWTSRTAEPHRPTYALVDIDPGPATAWEDVLLLARLHRDAFAHLGVTALPKVTGRRGIQVWVPIAVGPSFDETRAWVERVSRTVGAVVPDLVSWRWEVRERGGQARLDYTQNAINKTLVAPYSPRAVGGAPVSAPITWDELDEPWLRPDVFTVRTVLDRLAERGDPFRGVLGGAQVLPPLT
ncbi:DNA polymerase ligase N-terminal domain-containing protein [Cellulomonas marina]|uniref:Bifunctional non-homologous end joining protein LigD n=1 Tax=Cellulomonas marina TaxID=988821 RepID=A0A1I1AHP5_9CELL|nr:DNA polymerase ligase N-terminal domain-containing protein [Cellulomonas marina]GIG30775.1 ATP-dependent DNA ligase [Cellulomonas marina]SFB37477.1 bifunctional non-homologous end joining protein LigD [Cellulomonas marina]